MSYYVGHYSLLCTRAADIFPVRAIRGISSIGAPSPLFTLTSQGVNPLQKIHVYGCQKSFSNTFPWWQLQYSHGVNIHWCDFSTEHCVAFMRIVLFSNQKACVSITLWQPAASSSSVSASCDMFAKTGPNNSNLIVLDTDFMFYVMELKDTMTR